MTRLIQRLVCAGSAVLLASCAAGGNSGQRIVNETVAALGGATKLQSIATLRSEGAGERYALGQNLTPESVPIMWRVTEYRQTIDFAQSRWREDAVLTPAFKTGWPNSTRLATGYADGAAYDEEAGQAQRLDSLTARDRLAQLYHHPIGFLRATTAPGATLERARREGEYDAIDLVLASGERYTLFVHRGTSLPMRITSLSYEPTLGDVLVATTFEDFVEFGGVMLPRKLTRRIDSTVVERIQIAQSIVNPDAGGTALPAGARSVTASAPRVTVDETAPGIWYLAGEGHHSVLVEFADHLTLIEAPVNDARTLAVIAKARELRPGKPVTEVVNTHHHFDHAGGIRAAISEGLTIITHEGNRRFIEEIARRPSTVVPDALTRKPRPLTLRTVAERLVLTDGQRTVELYPISGSEHATTMLMAYFPAERLLVEADAYQPPPPEGPQPSSHPFAANLMENIERRGLRVDRVLPIHRYPVPYTALAAAAAAQSSP